MCGPISVPCGEYGVGFFLTEVRKQLWSECRVVEGGVEYAVDPFRNALEVYC